MTAPFKAFALEAFRQAKPAKHEALRNVEPEIPWNEHVKQIILVVANEFGLTYGDFVAAIGRVPSKTVGRARDEAILRARERYGYSSTELGTRFGMDHTSALYACKRAQKLRESRGT